MSKKIAVVFPGQGSQSIGMLAELAKRFVVVSRVFEQASAVLGYDLWELAQNGPENKLHQTEFAQPALLASGYSVWQVWQEFEQKPPAYMAGHSLGEYTALVSAGALSFADAIDIVATRGRLMQQAVAVDSGAMAAIIGLEPQKVELICKQAAQDMVLDLANFNAVGQIVISGHKQAVLRAIDLAKQAGAKMAVKIAVSVPSHCSLMRPAAEELAEKLEKINFVAPKIPVINNVDVTLSKQRTAIKDVLIRQLYCPVRWVETIQYMSQNGVSEVYECGPGKVLTGLVKRIDRKINARVMLDQLIQKEEVK